MRKRFLAILLVCMMVVGMLPTTALAAGTAENNSVKVELVKDSTTFSGKEVLRVDFYAISGTDKPDNHMVYLKYDATKLAPLSVDDGSDVSEYCTNFSINNSSALTANPYSVKVGMGTQISEVMLYTIITKGYGYICWKVTEPSGTPAFANYTHISSIFFGLKESTKFDALPSNIIGYSDPKEDDSITAASVAAEITVNGGGEGNVFIYKKDDGSADTMTVTPTINAGEGVTIVKPEYSGSVSAPTVTKNKGGAVELQTITITGETVEYGYSETNSAASVTNWQTGTTFNGLTAGKTLYFFARVTETAEHQAKASDGTSVTVADKEMPTCNAPTGVTATYGQTLSEITLTNPGGNTDGTWSWIDGTQSVGNVGEKNFKAKFAPTDTATYQTVSNIDVTVKVNPKSITPTIADISDQEYTGSAITPTVTVTGDGKTLVKDTDYTVEYSNNTNKGTATVTVKAKSGSNYTFSNVTKNFNIVAAASTISITSDPSKTYDGAAVTDPTVNKSGSTGAVTYAYYKNVDCTTQTGTADGAASNGAAPKNAGSYWVKASVAADANYGAATSAAKSFTISPKNISGANITLGTAPTYDGSEQSISISSVTLSGGPAITSGDYDITTGTDKATNVESKTLTIKGKGNFTGTATKTWSLQKATPTATDFSITTPTANDYTGSPITVSAPTSSKNGIGARTVKYNGSTTAPTDAGSYSVTFDVAEGQNYTAATGLSIGTLTINKVTYTGTNTASATVRSGQTTANATLTLPTLPAGASYGTVTVTTDTSSLINGTPTVSGNTLTYSTNSKGDSTSATLTIPVTGATNYSDYSVTVTVTAKDKNPAEVTLGTVPTSKTYGDANFTVTASAAHTEAGGTWTWTSSNESVLKVTGTSTTGTVQVVGQGSATITAKYESANYLGEAASASITVNKKNVTITGLSAQNKVYDGNTTATVNGTAVVSGKVGSDDVTVTAGTAAFANKTVGNSKTVTFSGYSLSGTAAGNYNLTAQPASVTANITAKDVTITGMTATNRVYSSGNTTVVLTGGTITGKVGSDTLNIDLTNARGTIANEDAGDNKAVTVTGVALSGADAGNYRLTGQPTGITVNITKATYGAGPALSQKVRATGEAQNIEVDVSTHFGAIKGAAVSAAAKGTDTNSIINSVTIDGNKVKFSVANTAVAGNTATINITISCTNFQDITSVLTVEMIDKEVAGVTISGVPSEAKTYGDADFVLTATAAIPGENGVWTWESSNTSILTVTGNGNRATVKIVGTGTGTTIKATYVSDTSAGERNTAAIRVVPATITVAAKNQSIYVNGTVPDLSSPVKDTHYTVTGLAGTDTLGGTLTMKYQKDGVDATPDATKTGTYDIVISGATAPAGGNYNDVVFTAGTLTISNKPSSGGGGGGSTPITVPVSDPKNQVKVTVTVSGTTATVQKIDLSKIDQAKGVTIDFTGLGRTIESAKLPTSAIKEIGATESGALTVKLTAGSVTFDNAALKAVADQADSQITLTLAPVKTSTLNASQKETVGDAPVFDLQLLSGSKAITDFKGGNVTVTLPHTLSKGQEPAGVVVYYLSNDGNPEACKTTYDAKSKLVTFTTTHFSLYFVGYKQPAAEWENPFTDVAEGAWYYDSIKYVYSNGMMVGIGDTKFSPDTTTTRGMIVTILYRLEGEPAVAGTSSFNDVASGRWYANAVKWAAENEIVGGYGNGNFGPEDPISREQMAAILYRYAAFKGFDITKTADLSKFTDSSKISDWSKAALSWANAEGLVNGKGGGILDPLGKATRAEIATILRNFCENVVK